MFCSYPWPWLLVLTNQTYCTTCTSCTRSTPPSSALLHPHRPTPRHAAPTGDSGHGPRWSQGSTFPVHAAVGLSGTTVDGATGIHQSDSDDRRLSPANAAAGRPDTKPPWVAPDWSLILVTNPNFFPSSVFWRIKKCFLPGVMYPL
jgi:hypothetical protein